MHPTHAGAIAPATPLVDVLHTIRLPHTRRDAHYLHRLVLALTEGHNRPLWVSPAPRTLVVRAPSINENQLPADAYLSTTAQQVPDANSQVEWALVANPARATGPRGADGRLIGRSKRQPLPEGEISGWVCRKLVGPLTDITVADTDRLPALPGHNPKTRHTITHTRYAITGNATVADQKALAELLAAGIGPGKAFGCGLLIVRKTL